MKLDPDKILGFQHGNSEPHRSLSEKPDIPPKKRTRQPSVLRENTPNIPITIASARISDMRFSVITKSVRDTVMGNSKTLIYISVTTLTSNIVLSIDSAEALYEVSKVLNTAANNIKSDAKFQPSAFLPLVELESEEGQEEPPEDLLS